MSSYKNKSANEPYIRLGEIANLPNCTILNNWVFQNFTLADEPFAKALQSFKICVLVNNNLLEKLLSLEIPATFDGRFKVTSAPQF